MIEVASGFVEVVAPPLESELWDMSFFNGSGSAETLLCSKCSNQMLEAFIKSSNVRDETGRSEVWRALDWWNSIGEVET